MENFKKSKKYSFKDYYLPFLFLRLYGEDGYFDPHHETTFSEYKKHILKLLDTIKAAITQTINTTDRFHFNDLLTQINDCKVEIKKAKTSHALSCATISFQTKIILSLIGHAPLNASKRKVTNQPSNWQLDLFRKISYTQTRQQKFNLLIHLIKEGFLKDDFQNYTDAIKKYQNGRLKGEDLFDWFKRLYSKLYLEIFDKD